MSGLAEAWTSLPNLHPLAVHLPVALLPLAVVVDLVAVARPRAMWLDRMAALLYLLGGLGAGLAVWLGKQAAESFVDVPPRVQPHIAEHSDWGHYAWYAFGLLALVRLAVCWRDRARETMSMRGLRLVVALAAAVGLAVLARAADLGGGLVYEHGLGVAAVGREAEPESPAAPSSEAASESPGDPAERLTEDGSGVVTWRPVPADAGSLAAVVEAVQGTSLEVLSPAPAGEGKAGLTLRVDGRVVLQLRGGLDDVQVDAELEPIDFDGIVGVAHHLGPQEGGGFFTLSSAGTARLLDRRDGEEQVLDEADVEVPQGPFVVGVSSAGNHLKGLLEGKTVTHGHIAAPPAGGCGLVVDGQGTIRIVRVVITPLEDG